MLEIKKYELRITNYSSAHSRHNERKMAANCGKNAAERDKSPSASGGTELGGGIPPKLNTAALTRRDSAEH